jgi:hypothetical protein
LKFGHIYRQVRRADERKPCKLCNFRRCGFPEARRGIDARADSRAAERQPVDALQRIFLHVRAPDLDARHVSLDDAPRQGA